MIPGQVFGHEDMVTEDVQFGAFILPLAFLGQSQWDQIMPANYNNNCFVF